MIGRWPGTGCGANGPSFRYAATRRENVSQASRFSDTSFAQPVADEENATTFASEGEAKLWQLSANRAKFPSMSEENRYIWQLPEWPTFRWDDCRLIEPLGIARLKQGHLLGSMARLGFEPKKRNSRPLPKTSSRVPKSKVKSLTAKPFGPPSRAGWVCPMWRSHRQTAGPKASFR